MTAAGALRVVIDTNVVVSAVLWQGTPGRLIAQATDGEIELCTSAALLDELADAAWQIAHTLPLIGCASFSITLVSASRRPGTARVPVD